MLKQIVQTLIHEHLVCVPPQAHKIPVSLIDRANEAGERLIRYMAELPCQTSLQRPKEDRADFGLIDTRDEPDKDLKFFLHVPFDFKLLVAQVPELQKALIPYQAEINELLLLHTQLNDFTLRVLRGIKEAMPEVVDLQSIVDDYVRSCTESVPGGNTVLRRLLYPDVPEQAGAMPHFDIDFIANHLGDLGGSLLAHSNLGEGDTHVVSPPAGHVLLFFGLKALIASGGKLLPLYHSATANAGEDRHALVQFGHVVTDPPVLQGNGKKFDHLFQEVGIQSPAQHYASQMMR